VLNLGEGNLSDHSLNTALHAAPENSIILIEDIDSALPSRNETSIGNTTTGTDANAKGAASVGPRLRTHSVTFSGILNAVDGIASQESRIIVMTTNVLTSLDPALTRPGRVDRVFYFGLANPDQARRLFVRFYPKEADLADKFAALVEPGAVSMAGLQGLFMQYADDPLAACTNYHNYLEELKRHDQPALKAPEASPKSADRELPQ
jgi:mitochondrial chaperone BCS1